MKSRKLNIALIFTAVTILGVGATLAGLKSVTETKQNVFTSDKAISFELREPAWDGYEFGSKQPGDGLTANPEYQGDKTLLGVNKAASYVPGERIPKDPTVKNSNDIDAVPIYTALGLQYFINDEEVTYNTFTKYIAGGEIKFNSNWKQTAANTDSKTQIFQYSKILEKGVTTEALFETIPLSLDIETIDGKLPKLSIEVTAYAIQSDNVPTDQVTSELLKLIK